MKNVILLLFMSSFFVLSSNAKEPESILKSTIKTITVYTNGAQVTRTAITNLAKGVNALKFTGLSSDIDEQTIKIKGNTAFTLLSINKYTNYLDAPERTAKVEALKAKLDAVIHQIAVTNVEIESLQAEEDLLLANKTISQKNASFVNDLRTMMELYRNRLKEVKMKKMEMTKRIGKQREEKEKLEGELAQLNAAGTKKQTGEIVIVIEVENAMPSVEFELTYITPNAGWYSTYDLVGKDINSPMEMIHRANIFQTTGIDWNDIRLTLSTNDPYESAVRPVLRPWWLDFGMSGFPKRRYYGTYNPNIRQVSGTVRDEMGESLIGASVVVMGTNVGTVTDKDGRYRINIPVGARSLQFSYVGYVEQEIPVSSTVIDVRMDAGAQLNEVVVTGVSAGYGIRKEHKKKKQEAPAPPPIVRKENVTAVTYAIDTPFSVPSDGQQRTFALREYKLNASYDYFTVPKLNEKAFLTAHVTGWDELLLTSGNGNVIFENVFIGKIFLDFQMINDTLDISLGKDDNIVVKRNAVKSFTKSNTIGFKRTETRAYEIEIRNKKSVPVDITIMDQFPISTNSKIDIKYLEKSGADLDDEKGFLTWKKTIPAHQKHTVQMKYSVKYPKNRRLYLGH